MGHKQSRPRAPPASVGRSGGGGGGGTVATPDTGQRLWNLVRVAFTISRSRAVDCPCAEVLPKKKKTAEKDLPDDNTTAPSIDTLPDELLIEVLSHVQDGVGAPWEVPMASLCDVHATLLDSVPLVCRRWHRLSRERRIWERVRVRVDLRNRRGREGAQRPYLEVGAYTLLNLRALLHAPALGHLAFHWDFQATSLTAPMTAALSALCRSRAQVRQAAYFYETVSMTAPEKQVAVLDLLWRSRDHVREVMLFDVTSRHGGSGRFGGDDGVTLPTTTTTTTESAEAEALPAPRFLYAVLASLRRLEKLTLRAECEPPLHARVFPYGGELAAASFPRLRSLVLGGWGLRDDDPNPGQRRGRLVADLLRAAAPALRELAAHGAKDAQEWAGARESLAHCVALHRVEMDATDLGVLAAVVPPGALPRLETLRLNCRVLQPALPGVADDDEDDGYDEEAAAAEDEAATRDMLQTLRRCAALDGLRELQVCLDSQYEHFLLPYYFPRLMQIVVPAATNLATLRLEGSPLPVDDLLAALPGLIAPSVRCVSLSPWHEQSAGMAKLGVLQDARCLDCSVTVPPEQGEPPRDRGALVADLARQARQANARFLAAINLFLQQGSSRTARPGQQQQPPYSLDDLERVQAVRKKVIDAMD